jgi:SnoaL-like protein
MGQPSIEDRVLIRELYDRYHWAFNTGDPDGLKACFVPGAELTTYSGHIVTPDTPAESARTWPDDPVAHTRQHHATTLIVDADEEGHDDRRRVRCYFMVTEAADPPAIVVRWSCFSRDVVQFVDGSWLIFSRNISLNHVGTA